MTRIPSVGVRVFGASSMVAPRRQVRQENLESHIECVPRPRRWRFSLTTKPAELLSFYPGTNSARGKAGPGVESRH